MKPIGLLIFCFIISNTIYGNIAILNGLKHEHSISSGNTLSGEIYVKNVSNEPQKVILYLQDLNIFCKKEIEFLPVGKSNNSLSSWLTIVDNGVTLLPNELRKISYSIVIPTNVTPSSYWSMIMVEGASPLSEQEIKKQVTVNSKIRYGIQIICNVDKNEPQNLTINDAAFNYKNNTIDIELSNTSVFIEKSSLTIELYNDNSTLITTQESKKENIYPNSCKTINIELDDTLLPGNYTCIIIIDNGGDVIGTSFDFSQH